MGAELRLFAGRVFNLGVEFKDYATFSNPAVYEGSNQLFDTEIALPPAGSMVSISGHDGTSNSIAAVFPISLVTSVTAAAHLVQVDNTTEGTPRSDANARAVACGNSRSLLLGRTTGGNLAVGGNVASQRFVLAIKVLEISATEN